MDFSEISDQDLLQACYRFGDYFCSNSKQYKYTSFKPLYQQGPTCGLTALGMYCGIESSADVEKLILEEAKKMGFTIQGEMFSTRNMYTLTKKLVQDRVELYEGYLDTDEIKCFLLKGGILLVPYPYVSKLTNNCNYCHSKFILNNKFSYDADANHEPCIKDGHKAHWALISGIIECQSGPVYIIARQGKSKMLGLWPLSLLAASNAQLNSIASNRTNPSEYIIPEGGINGENGLCGKSVMIFHS